MGEPITEKIHQLITITGARGTGKSILAATHAIKDAGADKGKIDAAHDAVAYFDTENSANRYREELRRNGLGDFGLYVDLQTKFTGLLPTDDDLLKRLNRGEVPWVDNNQRNALIGYYKHILGAFSAIPRNRYKVLVLDTGEKLEAGMAAYVETNKADFGITSTADGRLWTQGVFPLYDNLVHAIYGRGIETLILVFHLANVWENRRIVPGKVKASGKKILQRLSSLMFWLVNDSRNPNGEPAALLLKERMVKFTFENGRYSPRRMLPRRIPLCDWYTIDKYLQDGYNISSPKPTEVISPTEEEMISDFLTDAQTALMLADARLDEQRNTLAMIDAGLIPTSKAASVNPFGDKMDNLVTNVDNRPNTRVKAIETWKALGRPIPGLLRKLQGVGDDEIESKWDELVAEGE